MYFCTMNSLTVLFAYFLHVLLSQDVRLPPTVRIKQKPGEKCFNFGSQQRSVISCEVSGIPYPMLTWKKNKQDLEDHSLMYLFEHNALSIENASLIHEGDYQCIARSRHGVAMSTAVTLRMCVFQADRFRSRITNIKNVTAGDGFMLEYVEIPSFPKPQVFWVKKHTDHERTDDGKHIVSSQRIQLDDDGNLFFSHALTTDDFGNNYKYVSMVSQQVLDSMQGSSSYQVSIGMGQGHLYGPRLAFSSRFHYNGSIRDVIRLEGEQTILKCFFYANPDPEISWEYPTNLQESHNRFTIENFNFWFNIFNLSIHDQGLYTCRAKNKHGEAEETINLIVHAKPVFLSPNDHPTNVNITEGEIAIFKCKAYGNPIPTYTWFINDIPLMDTSRRSLSADKTTLTINNICRNCGDQMVIHCNASNAYGYVFMAGYLNVLERTKVSLKNIHTGEMAVGDVIINVNNNEEKQFSYKCWSDHDVSTPIKPQWYKLRMDQFSEEGYVPVVDEIPYIKLYRDGTLILGRKVNDSKAWSNFPPEFKCFASNGYSNDSKFIKFVIVDYQVSGFQIYWWMFMALFLIFLLLVLCITLCYWLLKNKGDEYDVDGKEKLNGNEPEKEMADQSFKTYKRPDGRVYMKGSRASLDSVVSSDEDASLNDYGLIDGGKFNEDGSFVGVYNEASRSIRGGYPVRMVDNPMRTGNYPVHAGNYHARRGFT